MRKEETTSQDRAQTQTETVKSQFKKRKGNLDYGPYLTVVPKRMKKKRNEIRKIALIKYGQGQKSTQYFTTNKHLSCG